jgi:4a-hydroxytetrahydrobiopterin dehydratase
LEANMSEEGWRAFLSAEGVDDWVVLHGGPVAAFRVRSLAEAARLAAAVAEVAGLAEPTAALTATGKWLTVRLTRELWATEASHIEIARAVSAVAKAHGAPADRSSVQEVQVAISGKPDSIDVGFWRAVLGYDPKALGHGSTVWMQELDREKPLRHAMHIDVSVAREQVHARLAAALEAGGSIVYEGSAPAAWILTDRAGNRVCIAAWPDGSGDPG